MVATRGRRQQEDVMVSCKGHTVLILQDKILESFSTSMRIYLILLNYTLKMVKIVNYMCFSTTVFKILVLT